MMTSDGQNVENDLVEDSSRFSSYIYTVNFL